MVKLKISESDLEDSISKNCEKLLGLKFIARQIKTPAGIIDILAYDKSSKAYCVIELKNCCLDQKALPQVLRYSNYLNSEKSKGGKRMFISLLIGDDLGDNLIKSVFHFDGVLSESSYGKVYYTLYDLDVLNGINFSYFDKRQKEYEITHLNGEVLIDKLINDCDEVVSEMSYLEYLLEKKEHDEN